MKAIKFLVACIIACLFTFQVTAQENEKLNAELMAMAKEPVPAKAVELMNSIKSKYKLDNLKDASTIEIMQGTVALAYLKHGDYTTFESYINQMKNKFNQTSYLNMGAAMLAADKKDLPVALALSEKTLKLYEQIKDDPTARSSDISIEDWKRFMTFAYYPYNDTQAEILYAMGKNKEALNYQVKAFDTKPELAFPKSVERYAQLLALNGQVDSAKSLLQNMARLGKLSTGMRAQFKTIYLKENGSESEFEAYLNTMQQKVQKEISKDLIKEMQDAVAPIFTVTDLSGKKVSLADYKGKIVVLDLWATWCVPCIASFPGMQKLVNTNPDVVFLFAAVQEKEPNALTRVKTYIKESKYNFHVIMDEPIAKGSKTYQIISKYKPNGIPSKYIIDKQGKIRFQSLGFTSEGELVNEVNAMLDILRAL